VSILNKCNGTADKGSYRLRLGRGLANTAIKNYNVMKCYTETWTDTV
jgi:hypothetical protein